MKRSNPYGLLMILPLLFLLTTLAGCTADSDCKFGSSAIRASPIPQGLGVNIHFTDPKPGEVKMIADAGFRWVRMDFVWKVTERERGRYDFAEYDRLIKALDEYEIRALFILDYGNPLYANGAPPRTAETRQAFVRWAVAAAKHFSGRAVVWEIYNEPNNEMFWPPRPDVNEYIELALAVSRAFRSEVPGEKLVGPAVSQSDFPFLEACLKAGLLDYWYAVSVHPYRQTDPETAAQDYCRLRKLIQQYRTRSGSSGIGTSMSDRQIQIISSEWGYSSVWRGMSEEKQGALFAREMLTNAANEIPISIWYDWRDDGSKPDEPEHHFGTVFPWYHDNREPVYDPKPAYFAAKTLTTFFSDYRFEKRLNVGSDEDYVLVFRKGDALRFAAWTTGSSHRVFAPLGAGQYTGIRHTGQDLGISSSDQKGLAITLTNAPVYFR